MYKEEFIRICKEHIHRKGIDEILDWLESGDFYTAPASSFGHNSFPGGLVQHSLNVWNQLNRLRQAYPEIECTDESVAICALFHDFCKINFYIVEKRNRKNKNGVWEKYDAYKIDEKFRFGGHGSKSVYLIQHFMSLTPEEATAINCHMGAYDNERVGQSYESFPFAWLLHVADEAATYFDEKKEEEN